MNKYISKLILVLEMLIFTTYSWNFVKLFFKNNETFIDLSELVLTSHLNQNCISLPVIILYYVYNLQKSHYNSSLYQDQVYSNKLTIFNFLAVKLRSYTKFSKIVFLFSVMLRGIYCWLLLALLFLLVILMYYITFIFKLVLILLLIYEFTNMKLTKTNNDSNIIEHSKSDIIVNSHNNKLNNSSQLRTYCKIAIIYFSAVTIFVYIYQFFKFKILFNQEYKSEIYYYMFFNCIKLAGFEVYTESKLFNGLSPHFLSNIIIVLLKYEIESIINYYEKNIEENRKSENLITTNISRTNTNTKNSNSNKVDNLSLDNEKLLDSNKDELVLLNKIGRSSSAVKDQTACYLFKINYFTYYLLKVLKSFCKKYYIIIIITMSFTVTSSDLSILMFIYYFISMTYFINYVGLIVSKREKQIKVKFGCKF